MYLQKYLKLHKFATTKNNFDKNDHVRHASSYNVHGINFQLNRISRSMKNENTNVFVNNRKLHKFATYNSNLEIKLYLAEVIA